ncbi:TPA: hypothetical protein ACHXA0_004153, partial [Escherichia coli]
FFFLFITLWEVNVYTFFSQNVYRAAVNIFPAASILTGRIADVFLFFPGGKNADDAKKKICAGAHVGQKQNGCCY